MFPDIPLDQIRSALDQTAESVLVEARISGPPVDSVLVAKRLGLLVAKDNRMDSRARFVRLRHGSDEGQGAILLGPEARPERRQWAVAHEIGEVMAHRVFGELGVSPADALPAAREEVANELAGRILLPKTWLCEEARSCDWDLLEIKRRFATASHELIARRMLDCSASIVVTVFDQGRMTWRRTNLGSRAPSLMQIETAAWKLAHEAVQPMEQEDGACRVRCWPVHEPDWRREIMRTELLDVF